MRKILYYGMSKNLFDKKVFQHLDQALYCSTCYESNEKHFHQMHVCHTISICLARALVSVAFKTL